jgi:signal transduction histidine kinase
MKSLRSLLVCKALLLCAVMVLGAMTWLTRDILESERERAEAEARADLEERTRLALWRMDAAGAAVLLRENQRPPAEYQAHATDSLPPADSNPLVHLHFEVRHGSLTSPQADEHPAKLQSLRQLLSNNGDIASILNHAAESGEKNWQALQKVAPELHSKIAQSNLASYPDKRASQAYQDDSSRLEKVQRTKAVGDQEVLSMASNQIALSTPNLQTNSEGILEIGSLRGVWIDQELFLLRNVAVRQLGDRIPVIQGVWLDQTKIRALLLKSISELLPAADLIPIMPLSAPVYGIHHPPEQEAAVSPADDPLALASFPFRLERTSPVPPPHPLPWNKPLVVGWAAAVLALLTATWLVRGIIRLSERRASFVSAVTHELRTPLTTFRLYSDMLVSGAVKPSKRGDYLRVLSREADRLSHLVENVLSFSQLERGSARSVIRATTVQLLLEPMRERLEARLATSGMQLELHLEGDPQVRTDAVVVEHILFNLTDNAAKYAAMGNPPVLRIDVRATGRHLELLVSDHGPGIPPRERKRIFRAFHKSAREAAESGPGVGLGLALSRRLAQSLKGTLDCVDAPTGACFILKLPLDSEP